MAVYRKKLVDKDGNTIIPAIGDIYGPVYTASLSSASGGIARYEFTPDTPVENSRVYAVKFPAPTMNNATIILGDGVTSGSILVPPVAATDTPNYELLDTTMINDTEPLLLMYNGIQWVCLNQKRSVSSGDIDWTTFTVETGAVSQVAVNTSWVTLKTFTIANDGNYILWTKAIRAANSTSGAIISMRIQKNGTNVLQFDAPTVANYAGNHDVLTQGMATFSASAGDAVTISIAKDRTNYTSNLGCQYALAQVC